MSDEYKVGYKKPPLHTRFGGTGGNMRGRGRKSRNLKTDLMEELAERVPIKTNGKVKRLTQQRALLKSLTVKAIKGDVRAASKVIDAVLRIIGADDGQAQSAALSAEDQAILDAFLARDGDDDAG